MDGYADLQLGSNLTVKCPLKWKVEDSILKIIIVYVCTHATVLKTTITSVGELLSFDWLHDKGSATKWEHFSYIYSYMFCAGSSLCNLHFAAPHHYNDLCAVKA